MKPIYTKQDFLQTSLLRGSVEGYTRNMVIKGVTIKNIVTSSKGPTTGNPHDSIKFTYNTSEIPDGESEWTLFFNITNTTFQQGEFDKLVLMIETEGGNNRVTQVYPVTEGIGHIIKNITINTKLKPGIDISRTNIIFWSELQGKSVTIENVMLLKGTYHNWIDYFDNTKSLGPEINIFTNNKNIAHEEYIKDKLFYNGTEVVTDKLDTYASYLIPVHQNTKYTLSKKDIKTPGVNPRLLIAYFDSYPELGKKGISHETFSGEKATFTTPIGTQYILAYLGYIEKQRIPVSRMVQQVQLEENPDKTFYVKPGFSKKTLTLPNNRELKENEILIYDKDYKKMVIKYYSNNIIGNTLKITDIFDANIKTYDDNTWISVEGYSQGKPEHYLNGSISFEWLQEPLWQIDRPYKNAVIELGSGQVIFANVYRTITKKGDTITFTDSFYNYPSRIIEVRDITRILKIE